MKTKITIYTLLITFILLAIQCQVDSQMIPNGHDSPPPYDEVFPPPLYEEVFPPQQNGIPEEPGNHAFHRYTEEQRQQVRQNLHGSYRDHHFQYMTMTIMDNQLRYLTPRLLSITVIEYFVDFPIDGAPRISFWSLGRLHIYTIEFSPDSHTNIIGLRLVSNTNMASHFSKENNQHFPHDEL